MNHVVEATEIFSMNYAQSDCCFDWQTDEECDLGCCDLDCNVF